MRPKSFGTRLAGLGLLLAWFFATPALLSAHALTITRVLVSFDEPGLVAVRVELDLTPFIGPEAYHALSLEKPAAQQAAVETLLPEILRGLQLYTGTRRMLLAFQGCALPQASEVDFLDPTVAKYTALRFGAVLPADGAPMQLVVPIDTTVPHPVAFTAQIPSAGITTTCLIDESGSESDAFAWAEKAPGRQTRTAAETTMPEPPRAPWYRELATYLRTGFLHIVPEGTDHILFVLGLFFLGITWRNLLAQTTVFTIAHATTLFLSTYGIFSLPSRWVEPAIALSIAFIALENVWSPKLGPSRLAVVFFFGLVHGLGFASSLQEVPFPKHGFFVALLGFNFGVDFGQLFIIGLAFLAVGWFRKRPWFRARVAIPCSLAIAATGLLWAGQRIMFYWIR